MATSKKTSANTDAIRVIAQEIRDVPKENEGSSSSWIYAIASRLLLEALDRGAFSAIEHVTLRALIDKAREPRERDPDFWEWAVFDTAVDWIERRCPDLAKLPRTSLADKCALIASALEAQADGIEATKATADSAAAPFSPDPDDLNILRVLHQAGTTLSRAEIESKLPKGKQNDTQAIGRHLIAMQDPGLVRQPKGKGGTYAITSKGSALLPKGQPDPQVTPK